MIDIAVSAQERADIKAEMKRTQEAYNTDVSIAILGGRVLVLPIMEEEKESLIIIDERIKKELKGNGLERAIVKSIGADVKSVVAGDIVYVYPNQFEATIAFNGVGYLVYQERAVIAKDLVPVIPQH
jgi:predicted GNAT family acetyltransferase